MDQKKRSGVVARMAFIAIALCCASMPVNSSSNPFAEAMRAMMEAFGMLNNNNSSSWSSFPAQGAMMSPYLMQSMPMQSMASNYGMNSMPFNQPAGGFSSFAQQMPQAMNQPQNMAWSNNPQSQYSNFGNQTPLEGSWQGTGDTKLIVRGEQFSLARGEFQQSINGRIQVQDQYVALQVHTGSRPYYFEFAIDQGRMVMRAENGSLLLFRQAVTPYSTLPSAQQIFR